MSGSNLSIDFWPTSIQSIFLNYCTKFHYRWQCNIRVLSQSCAIFLYHFRVRVSIRQKYYFTFLIEIACLNEPILLKFCIQVQYWWEYNFRFISRQEPKRYFMLSTEINYLTNKFCLNFMHKFITDDSVYLSRALLHQG